MVSQARFPPTAVVESLVVVVTEGPQVRHPNGTPPAGYDRWCKATCAREQISIVRERRADRWPTVMWSQDSEKYWQTKRLGGYPDRQGRLPRIRSDSWSDAWRQRSHQQTDPLANSANARSITLWKGFEALLIFGAEQRIRKPSITSRTRQRDC